MQVISGFIKRVIESFIQTIPSNGRFIKYETDVCAWVIESLDKTSARLLTPPFHGGAESRRQIRE